MKFLLLMGKECLTGDEEEGGGGNVTFDPLSFPLSAVLILYILRSYYLITCYDTVYSADNPDLTHLQTHSHLIQHRRLTTGKWKLERRQAWLFSEYDQPAVTPCNLIGLKDWQSRKRSRFHRPLEQRQGEGETTPQRFLVGGVSSLRRKRERLRNYLLLIFFLV